MEKTAVSWRRTVAAAVAVMISAVVAAGVVAATDKAAPQRILLDTDMDTDDLLALMYLLKQNRSEFELKVFHSGIPITLVPLDATNTTRELEGVKTTFAW